MPRKLLALVASLGLLLGLLVGFTASAATVNATECRKAAGNLTDGVNSAEVLKYDECRFDKLDAAVKALSANSPTPSPSPSSTPSPSATPTKTPTPTPSSTPSSTTAPAACSTVKFTGEGSDGVGPATASEQVKNGGYDISAEQWGVKTGYKSTLRYCSKDSWNVDITALDNDGQHAVQSYPSIRRIYHDWSTTNFANDPRLSAFPKLAVDFDVTSPASCSGCIYETAFDNWLNGIGNSGSEQMIWLRNVGQRPAGDVWRTDVAIDGRTWAVWKTGDSKIVSFVPATPVDAGTVDVKAFVQYQVDNAIMPANGLAGGATDPYVGQVSLGVEPVKVSGQRWDFNGFKITDH